MIKSERKKLHLNTEPLIEGETPPPTMISSPISINVSQEEYDEMFEHCCFIGSEYWNSLPSNIKEKLKIRKNKETK